MSYSDRDTGVRQGNCLKSRHVSTAVCVYIFCIYAYLSVNYLCWVAHVLNNPILLKWFMKYIAFVKAEIIYPSFT